MNSVETVKVEDNNKISTAIQLILKKIKSTYRHKTWSIKSLPHLQDHTITQLFKISIQNQLIIKCSADNSLPDNLKRTFR